MRRGTSRREFVTKSHLGAAAASLARRHRGAFVPFYEVGGGVPYQMYFDLA